MQAQQEVVEEQALQEEIGQDNSHSPPNPIMALEHDGIKVGVSFFYIKYISRHEIHFQSTNTIIYIFLSSSSISLSSPPLSFPLSYTDY